MTASCLPVEFLVADHRHLPELTRPGPALQATLDTLANGGRPPKGAARAAERFHVAADAFIRDDARTVARTVALLNGDRPAARVATPAVLAHLGVSQRRFTEAEVTAAVAQERGAAADSYNRFVTDLERDARSAYRRAACWQAAMWVVPLATAVTSLALTAPRPVRQRDEPHRCPGARRRPVLPAAQARIEQAAAAGGPTLRP